MAPTRRSSARLQNSTPQKHVLPPGSASKLSSLVERDETPDRGIQPMLNSIAASAPAKTSALAVRGDPASTPSAPRIRPSVQDMHPSRHQSTAKKLHSAKRTGFVNEHAFTQSPSTASRKNVTGKSGLASPRQNLFSSPSFEFRFTRPSTDLSSEAQRMMDEVREQAAKIKSELAFQRSNQDIGSSPERKVANAKGKIGRFSDVHMDQFKRMNSIANHPSSFRADPARIPPIAKSLKRSNSKAGLDKPEDDLTRSPSNRLGRVITPRPIASSAKRLKNNALSPAPLAPPLFFTQQKKNTDPKQSWGNTQATVPSAVTTPTKTSLARSASVKSLKRGKSMIPSLTRSPSTKTLNTPEALKPVQPHTDGKVLSAFASKLTSVKSILRRPQFKFSDDPVKLAAGTHFSTPEKAAATTRGQHVLERVEATPGTPSHRKEKHVNFSSSPDVLIPSSPVQSPCSPTQLVQYPTLPTTVAEVVSPTDNKVRGGASKAGPSDFTFRSDKTIRFGTSAAPATPTIRHVRASDASVLPNIPNNRLKELPSVPHGLSNKKRKRDLADGPDDENKENTHEAQEQTQSPAKKARTIPSAPTGPTKTPAGKLKTPIKNGPLSAKRRGMLSLSRLSALSKPKQRG